MALLRVYAVLLLFLTALYWPLLKFLSAGERERLEWEFAEKAQRQPTLYSGAREAFVQKRLAAYEKRMHRKLVLWVYGLPLLLVTVLIYATSSD